MAFRVVEGAKSSLVEAIKVVLLFGLLIGVIVYAKANPDSFLAVVNKVAATLIALITWVCDLVISVLPPPPSG